MVKKDVASCTKLLNNYLSKFKIYTRFTEELVKHLFLPRKDVIFTYVVERDK